MIAELTLVGRQREAPFGRKCSGPAPKRRLGKARGDFSQMSCTGECCRAAGRFSAPGRCSLSCPSAARPWLAVQRRRRRAATVQYRNTRRDTHRRARRIRIADEKERLPVSRSRARLMSDVAWTVAHASRSARPHDGDYFARRYLAQRLPLQRSSQDWWRSPEVCKGGRNAHVGVGLITIAHHEKDLMVLLPSRPACL